MCGLKIHPLEWHDGYTATTLPYKFTKQNLHNCDYYVDLVGIEKAKLATTIITFNNVFGYWNPIS